jgi:hypothetical protein
MAAKTMQDIVGRIEKGKGDVETVRIKVHKANLIVGNRVTTAGEVVPATLTQAARLVNEGLAALAE